MSPRTLVVGVVSAVLLAGACDPVHDDAVEALGGEAPGVEQGPLHRPGQPCLVCHGGPGPGSPTFSVAGTVFRTRGDRTALPGAIVTLTDASGVQRSFATNEAGNFYVEPGQWAPPFPLRAAVSYGGVTIEMQTRISGDGSCGGCHSDPPSRDAVGHVYGIEEAAP